MRSLAVGDNIAGYRIEGLAGRGGMGLVYRARQRRPDRIVALKVIAPELAADPAFRARFELESAVAAEIEHPNVIPVYDVGEEDGLLYISMRFVNGVDLGRLLTQSGRVERERGARLVAQVADALDAAHARGLVHRDVKPGNVLVADRDHVYLTDFGLTKRTSDSHGMTRTGMFVGSVDYIAPEQIEGRRLDARADVYALGCVSYELLAGSVPFGRDSDVATIFAHIHAPPPRLSDVPEPLASAVQRAMAKRPEDRFLSAGDFGRAVSAGAAGRIVEDEDRIVATGAAAIADAHAPITVTDYPPAALAQRTPKEPPKPAKNDQISAPGGRARVAAPGDPTRVDEPSHTVPESAFPPRQAPTTPAGSSTSAPSDDRGQQRPRSRAAALLAGALVIIVLAVLAVSGVFASGHHRPKVFQRARLPGRRTPPAPTTKSYVNTALGVGFAYPADWEALSLRGSPADFGIIVSGATERRCALLIERGAGPASSSQQARFAFVRDRSGSAENNSKHYQLRAIQAEQGANIAGVGLIRIADGQGAHIGFFFKGRDLYIFDCITRASSLDRVDRQEFAPLLASVRIG